MNIVYTAILGGSDSLKTAPKGADLCVCFVDDRADHSDAKGWELRTIPHAVAYLPDPRRRAWWMRAVPHVVFSGDRYDRVIWIDASFTLTDVPRLLKDAGDAPLAALRHHKRRTCYEEGREIVKVGQAERADVEPQLLAYHTAGFRPDSLSISCILVRDRSADVQRFNETWHAETSMYPGDNTQISLDYSAWVNGLAIKALRGVRHHNPYSTHDHDDHKKRRKPYARVVAA